MPYIKKDDREDLGAIIGAIDSSPFVASTSGELNYLITKLCLSYIHNNDISYQTYNDIIGALECAKLELYRRRIASYEDIKASENGDVY